MSLSERALSALLEAIRGGRFPDGRLPPEVELARLLGVSRTTIRSALQSLEERGLVARAPGRGTHIVDVDRPSLISATALAGFERVIADAGYKVGVNRTWTTVPEVPDDVLKDLGLKLPCEFYELNGVYFADDEPAVWVRDYIPVMRVTRPLVQGEDMTGNFFEFSADRMVARIDYALAELIPETATKAVVDRLGVELRGALLAIREVHYSRQGLPLAVSVAKINDRLVRLVFKRMSVEDKSNGQHP